jgi:hypothetical protein
MKITYLFVFLINISCVDISRNKSRKVLFCHDILNCNKLVEIGKIYLRNNKITFLENKNISQDKIDIVRKLKYKISKINSSGYLEMMVPNDSAKIEDSHYIRAYYLKDKDFWQNFILEMKYGYNITIE